MLHSLYQVTVVISLCLLIIACGQSDSDKRIEQQILLRFEHYYQSAAVNEQKIIPDELSALDTL